MYVFFGRGVVRGNMALTLLIKWFIVLPPFGVINSVWGRGNVVKPIQRYVCMYVCMYTAFEMSISVDIITDSYKGLQARLACCACSAFDGICMCVIVAGVAKYSLESWRKMHNTYCFNEQLDAVPLSTIILPM